MRAAELERLPSLPSGRTCACGGRIAWSHLEYLGTGRTLPLYLCAGCGLAYRGAVRTRSSAPPRPSRRPLPDQGHPDNPVLDRELADRLREMLAGG